MRPLSAPVLTCALTLPALAGIDTTTLSTSSPSSLTPSATGSTRYGPFDGLDKRSSYGQGVFPEPFLVDDSDLEVNEARLDWLHTSTHDETGAEDHSDVITGEVEKGFGNLTLEIEAPIERDNEAGVITHGFGNIDVGARYPLYEYVAHDNSFDTTFGIAGEAGIPTTQVISRTFEFVPKVFNDLRVGDHFTLQSILGYSMLAGPSSDRGGLETFEYGFVFGWTIRHEDLAILGLQQLIPVFEISGSHDMNLPADYRDSVLGNIGFRANLNAIGPVQPRLGAGFVFPINAGARMDTHYGFVVSMVFEY